MYSIGFCKPLFFSPDLDGSNEEESSTEESEEDRSFQPYPFIKNTLGRDCGYKSGGTCGGSYVETKKTQ